MIVKIKRLHDAAVIPQYAHPTDSGFDLVATEDVIVRPGETVRVPTGLAFDLPPGYELQIRPRSGITSKTKLRVVLGTCDSSYRGEVSVIVDNIAPTTPSRSTIYETLDGGGVETEHIEVCVGSYGNDDYYETQQRRVQKHTYIIRKGDRIAQGIIAPVIHATFAEVDDLSDTERGSGGFGSTGVSGAKLAAAIKEMRELREHDEKHGVPWG